MSMICATPQPVRGCESQRQRTPTKPLNHKPQQQKSGFCVNTLPDDLFVTASDGTLLISDNSVFAFAQSFTV
jgi:hypothetical protein